MDARRAAMRALYARVDAAMAEAGLVCGGCGACCHFETADHILYAGALERAYLAAVSVFPEEPDADAELLARGVRCPFQKNARCEAREGRVLGCRLHFCARAGAPEAMELSESFHAELKAMHEAFGEEWDYRPLLPCAPTSPAASPHTAPRTQHPA